jgi:hypothetical protein
MGLIMFTVEMDWDETAIIILDQNGGYEDVQFIVFDDIVYIRQWDEDSNRFSVITMSPIMFEEFRSALELPEGAYMLSKNED